MTAILIPVIFIALLIISLVRMRNNPAPELLNVEQTPEEPFHIGDSISFDIFLAVPWGKSPAPPYIVEIPEKLQLLKAEEKDRSKIGLGISNWRCRITVQPVSLGETEAFPAEIRFNATDEKSIAIQLPQLSIESIAKSDDIPLAVASPLSKDDIPQKKSRLLLWISLAVITLIAVIAFLLTRSKKTSAPVRITPPWQIAMGDLQKLEDSLPVNSEHFFVTLTDILRSYLEKRFELPATEQATPEFLHTLQHSRTLSSEQTLMLTDFLTAADMIKFAKGESTQEQQETALKQAVQFVVQTKPRTQTAGGNA